MFEEEIKALEDIESLKREYNLDPNEVLTLRMLKLTEINKQTYNSMKEYFIKIHTNINQ